MEMRLTQTTESGVILNDATGTVEGMDFDENEPACHKEAAERNHLPVVVLKYLPVAMYLRLDQVESVESSNVQMIAPKPCPQHEVSGVNGNCSDRHSCRNFVAVTPFTNVRTWTLEVMTVLLPKLKLRGSRCH